MQSAVRAPVLPSQPGLRRPAPTPADPRASWPIFQNQQQNYMSLANVGPSAASGGVSLLNLILATLGIAAAIIILLMALGILNIDTARPVQWLEKQYNRIFSILTPTQTPTGHLTELGTTSGPHSCFESRQNHMPVVHGVTTRSTSSNDAAATVLANRTPQKFGTHTVTGSSESLAIDGTATASANNTVNASLPIAIAKIPPVATAPVARALGSKGEEVAQAALKRIFGEQLPFTKVRPAWLKNPRTQRAMELDLYNDQLKLSCEVDGLQHYVYPNSFHKSRSQFDDQVYRDRLKELLCKQEGVALVRVPFTVPHNQVESYIRQELHAMQVPSVAK